MRERRPSPLIAQDRVQYPFRSNGQDWLVAWHSPSETPLGTRHGSAAVCITPEAEVVLVTEDGETWVLPGGRPEGDEDWRATLEREVREEACAEVEHTVLLGFARGVCTRGAEEGLVLVRSFWRADVSLMPWAPMHEIVQRRLLSPDEALAALIGPDDGSLEWLAPQPLFPRLFQEALHAPPGFRPKPRGLAHGISERSLGVQPEDLKT